MEMMPNIEELRKMRKNLGISQKDLAKVTGVSQSYIARLEKGTINPTYSKIKAIYEYLTKSSERASTMVLTCDRIMTKNVVVCRSDDSILNALNIMRDKGFSQLPVVNEENKVIGTITENNINDMLLKGMSVDSLRGLTVRRVMSDVLPQVDRNTPVNIIYQLLKYSNAVLVIEAGNLVGIITKADILKTVAGMA
ncbi:CBS domain-containing protein [Thermoplasma sp.]|uniref:helix-turn-helix domain-containing protein n=1 Tax=Thermoplasma sp. TaxID=1973142 RepID=UPI0012750BB0|nr:CBS domain-containing protein [Thermoplasma sp.]KAA8922317.1 MAG: CBS domain-containing protein [Thermoplasma sp.]